MMKSVCVFNEDYELVDVVFEGLTGREEVSDLREAVDLMRVKNPILTFGEMINERGYDNIPQEKYLHALNGMKAVLRLFHRPGEPKGRPPLGTINVMELLVNALVKVAEQDAELRELKKGAGR